ncbi:Ubiquitin-60S ribosomal L40, partial [Paramuricea clavata]
CATASVKNRKKCSQCGNTATEDNEIYKEYLETLDFLFPPEEEADESAYQAECAATGIGSGKIYVTTISGESVTLSYYPLKKIFDIKKEVEKELRTPPEKQRLLYRNKELK